MKNNAQKLPEAELDVMLALWDMKTPALRADIGKKLESTHPMAQTTLLTLLSRLSEKGFLNIIKNGRASLYQPIVTKEEYLSEEGKSFFKVLCKGKISELATALCSSGLTKEDFDELKKLLEENKL